jgi:hypothetical protein
MLSPIQEPKWKSWFVKETAFSDARAARSQNFTGGSIRCMLGKPAKQGPVAASNISY